MRLPPTALLPVLGLCLAGCAAAPPGLGLLTPDWSRPVARSTPAVEEPPEPVELLEPQVLAAVRRRHRSSLGTCQKEVWSSMRIDVAVRVAKEGAVTEIAARGPSPRVAFCVERAVGTWRFPPSEHQSFGRFALVFHPG